VKIHLASSRPIGERCIEWASANLPDDCELIDNPDNCDLFISVLYAHLVSEDFIAGRKCFNFHPGLLPKYRGAGAFSWSIINGEKRTGITLHELDVDIDTGPIISQESFQIEAWDTSHSLYNKAMDMLFRMFKKWFAKLVSGEYSVTSQDASLARTYFRKDLRNVSDLTKYVRALHFPGKDGAFYVNSNGERIELQW
jgi:methionyl-tRNA formyltransferase